MHEIPNITAMFSPHLLACKLVPDDLAPFHFHLFIQPLPVTATFDATLAGAAIGTGVEATHAVLIQAVAQVSAAGDQQTSAVVHFALSGYDLPGLEKGHTSRYVAFSESHHAQIIT